MDQATFMAVYREKLICQPKPNEELNFRNAAKANLEAALGPGVERNQIGPGGLVARGVCDIMCRKFRPVCAGG